MTGDGTELNPYTVGSVEDLAELSGKSGYVIITNDIDFASVGKQSFGGITTGGDMYIDGQGHTINNFYREIRTGGTQGGLFIDVFNGSVKDLNITNAYILDSNGATNIGIFAAKSGNCTFTNVTITGAILGIGGGYTNGSPTGSVNVGGFIGRADVSSAVALNFYDCKVNVNINNVCHCGGFIGGLYRNANYSTYARFRNCISACKLSGLYVGGFIGRSENFSYTYFYDCISQCDITAMTRGGGFTYDVGSGTGVITNCASICNLKGIFSDCVLGGLDYNVNHKVTVTQSYAKCTISNAKTAYGICATNIIQSYSACTYENVTTAYGMYGYGSHTVTSSFYDMDIAPDSVDNLYGATTEKLKSVEWIRE